MLIRIEEQVKEQQIGWKGTKKLTENKHMTKSRINLANNNKKYW